MKLWRHKATKIEGPDLSPEAQPRVGFWPFRLPERMPVALPIRGIHDHGEKTWEDWDQEMLKKYPVRFRLGYYWPKELRRIFYRRFWNHISHAHYFVVSHTIRRYHLLDLRDPKNGYDWGWRDSDRAILFAVMKILADFVEQEDGFSGHIDWEATEEHRRTKEVGLQIYRWWTLERPALLADIDKLQAGTTDDYEKGQALKDELDIVEDRNLVLVIQIRRHLWT